MATHSRFRFPRFVGRPRRGVVLLIMLGLLATFTLIAATFVVSAGHFRRGATTASRAEQIGDPVEVLLQQALMQVVRGSTHPMSAVGPHSLLEDIYGNSDSVSGMVVENAILDNSRNQVISAFDVFQRFVPNLSVPNMNAEAVSPSHIPRTIAGPFPTNMTTITQTAPNAAPMLLEFCAVGFGWDKEPGNANYDDDGNGVIDDVSETMSAAAPNDDMLVGSTYAHPMQVGVPSANWAAAWSSKIADSNSNPPKPLPIIDNVDNYYAGRVITFLTGEAAGKSTMIVRSKVVPVDPTNTVLGYQCATLLWCDPLFGNVRPATTDRFIINGKPFSGTGFGSNPYQNNFPNPPVFAKPSTLDVGGFTLTGGNTRLIVANPALRSLDMPYFNPIDRNRNSDLLHSVSGGVPIALLPNPTDPGYREYLRVADSMVDADEDYDAPDVQNMLLAYRMWNQVRGRYEVVFPSLHRPDLVHHFVRNFKGIAARRWTELEPHVRRRLILRPEPSDHFDHTQDAALDPRFAPWNPSERFDDGNLNQQWDPGETYDDANGNGTYDVGDPAFANPGFDAILGPWDVDNDVDGEPDSIWVDLGMPVTTMPDGRFVKPLFAILCLDLDGRLNVNAHGSPKHYGVNRDLLQSYNILQPYNTPGNSTEERVYLGSQGYSSILGGIMKDEFTDALVKRITPSPRESYASLYVNDAPGTYNRLANTWIEVSVGQGYSPADINLAGVFARRGGWLPRVPITNAAAPPSSYPRLSVYRSVLEGLHRGVQFGGVTTTISSGSSQSLAGFRMPLYGRYGEPHLLRAMIADPTIPSPHSPAYPGLNTVPRPGISVIQTTDSNAYGRIMTGISGYTAAGGGGAILSNYAQEVGMDFRADDDVPQAPAPMRNGPWALFGNSARDDLMSYDTTPDRNPIIKISRGAYGTPGDPDGDGFVALDIAGQPIYKFMGTPDESVDEPAEINLYRGYSPMLNIFDSNRNMRFSNYAVGSSARTPLKTPVDANFSPSELAYVLLSQDAAMRTLPGRLAELSTANDGHATDHQPLLTSESWDIPCPHIVPTPELSRALRELGLPVTNPSLGDLLRARFYLAHGSYAAGNTLTLNEVTQLANVAMRSYRWHLNDDIDESAVPPPQSMPANNKRLLPHFPFGRRITPAGLARQNLRLVSSDLVLGLRMDINAPFGNNFDDDNDFVVDEPMEWLEYVLQLQSPLFRGYMYPPANVPGYAGNNSVPLWGNSVTFGGGVARFGNSTPFDGNNDGNYHRFLDETPRQQFAKNLYCLMMLLLDERYVMPLESPHTNGLIANASEPKVLAMPPHNPTINGAIVNSVHTRTKTVESWLTARRIAQWAVNVVDFRDRDAVMTPFEFDVDPFFDNDGDTNIYGSELVLSPERPLVNGNPTNGTWDVDGLVIDDPAVGSRDSEELWRGVVWGCEYPDLILTETLAFHDRRTANTDKDTTGWGPGSGDPARTKGYWEPPPAMPDPMNVPDPDWDQIRMPQGTAIFELYATGNANLTLDPTPTFTTKQSALPRELYTADGLLDVSRVVTGTDLNAAQTGLEFKANPVWRLAITAARDVTHNPASADDDPQDVAFVLNKYPSICSLDPVNGNFGSLTQTLPSFSLLPPGVTPTTYLRAPRISRVVAFSTATLPGNVRVDAIPEPIFADTVNNPVDVFFHQVPVGLQVQASPGDYIVVGPYRQATEQDGTPAVGLAPFHNITQIGRNFQSEMVTVTTSGGTAKKEAYSLSYPIIDLGVHTGTNPFNTYPNRSFVVTSINGVHEYPAALAYNMSETGVDPTYTSFTRGISALGDLVIAAKDDNSVLNDAVNQAQIRRPITIACAITDTRSETVNGVVTPSSNNGRPIGLNISEPLVSITTNLASSIPRVAHRSLYYNFASNISRTTTSEGRLSGLFWRDTWTTTSAPAANQGPNPDHPFDGSVTGPAPMPAPPEQPILDIGTVRNHEFIELGLPNIPSPTPNPLLSNSENQEKPLLDATYLRAKSVFLQRLADPTRLWHKDVNPYITIDWMPIDLTIFNGEPNQVGTETDKRHHDPDNPYQAYYDNPKAKKPDNSPSKTSQSFPLPYLDRRVRFGSRQKGSPTFPFPRRGLSPGLAGASVSYCNLWSQPNWLDERWDWDTRPSLTVRTFGDPERKASYNNKTLGELYQVNAAVKWQHPLQHTLGYLNQGYHFFRSVHRPPVRRQPDPDPDTIPNTRGEFRETHPFVRPPKNRPTTVSNPPQPNSNQRPGDWGWYNYWDGGQPDVTDRRYLGTPRRPFNWLPWNNRPYASAPELMLVPAVGPSRLLFEFDMRRTALPTAELVGPITETTSAAGAVPYDAHRAANVYLPFMPSALASGDIHGGYLNAPPFKHLLNFFGSTPAGANPLDMPAADRNIYAGSVVQPTSMAGMSSNSMAPGYAHLAIWQPNFFRVLEFLTVPTRFSGAVKQHLHGTLAFNGPGGQPGLWNTAAAPMIPAAPGVENPLVPASSPIRNHPSGRWEHPGWPFTAPFNSIPKYREPGRINVNTIPISQPAGGLPAPFATNNEAFYNGGDRGAAIWRGVINNFFPWQRFLATKPSTTRRAGDLLSSPLPSAVAVTPPANRVDHASQDYIDNFFGLFASMRSDARTYDVRGPNALWEGGNGGDDKIRFPNSAVAGGAERMDPRRPSWVTNPVRSYLEDFTATVPPVAFPNAPNAPFAPTMGSGKIAPPYNTTLPEVWRSADGGAGGGFETMLAVDGTLLRRRDTTWQPWGSVSTTNRTGNFAPTSPVHADDMFDPLFALNFPRPVNITSGGFGAVTGYTMAMANNDPNQSTALAGTPGPNIPKVTDYRNTDRNPFFRYQLYTKLGSSTTTRSNVYAIWITCGFFECERMDPNATIPTQDGMGGQDFAFAQRFPDGFRIVRELGSEIGDTKRHKIFAIFDRSIPVGFKRGENYNVDRAFLFRQILN